MPSKSTASATAALPAGRRIQTRRSGVHGKGVFALVDIPRGTRIIEYVGEIITWDEAQRRHPHDPDDPNHTFYFHIDEDRVIDALHGGNASRWINHSCAPNCIADEQDGRIFIKARRAIRAGEELNYDYGLVIDEPLTSELKADYPCWCGSRKCRGTLLSSGLDGAEDLGGKPKKGARPRR
ncbi:SET domain-containing protein-lysine N-methyltransferase [Ottowia sp.]|mgnify:CR=1 FL=1|uniref:SET domain-containing protein n=1 Tax=Ottowia sp. TaxID=1898956 RepID=UPI0025DA635D|nr:SET domain-containing protein-lysine N-methyltransferase [Ottowia sp.]